MAFAVGETLTLGAMVHQQFRGDVRWEIGNTALSFRWDTGSEGPVPVQVEDLELDPVGQRGSFRGIHWVNVELPLSLMGEDGTPLRLRFAPSQRPGVDLPGGAEPFAARFSDR